MTRRERKQLLRTASDIFRMVPLAVSAILRFIWRSSSIELFGFTIALLMHDACNENFSARRWLASLQCRVGCVRIVGGFRA